MADSMSSSFKAGPRGRRPRRQNPWRSLPSCEARVLDGGTTSRIGILQMPMRRCREADLSYAARLAICKKRRIKFRYAAKYGISSPQRSLGRGARTSSGPHYRDEKNTPFNNSVLNTKRQIQVQELELELELELKKGNSGTQPGALAPVHNSTCSRFDSDHHAL